MPNVNFYLNAKKKIASRDDFYLSFLKAKYNILILINH